VITLRQLGRADAAEYRTFRLEALRATPTAFTSTYAEDRNQPLEWTVDRLTGVGRPDDVTLGAFDGDLLVGIAGLTIEPRRQVRHKAILFGMAVAPAAKGQGVGKALVSRIVELAESIDGLQQIVLTVSEGNMAAERLYRACGFEQWGREPAAVVVDGQPVAKLHLIRWL
jgi:RimJ/RimL family protein N-acetyltransferase